MNHHLVLVSLDALRADWLGSGHRSPSPTPSLDRLAGESVRFERAITPATWTLPAHMSMLSGLEPFIHGCTSTRHRYPPETLPFPLLFELLQQADHHGMALVSGAYMEAQFGFGRGVAPGDFHEHIPLEEALTRTVEHAASHPRTFTLLHTMVVHDYPRVASDPRRLKHATARDPDYAGIFPADRNFSTFIASLGKNPELPAISDRDRAYLTDLYRASTELADEAMAALVRELEAKGLWDDTTLIVTSDHGESLGEVHQGRSFWSHGGPPYQEQMRIPLLLRPATHRQEIAPPGIVAEMVSLIDLVPTVLDLCGVSYEREQFDGQSMLALVQGQVASFETRPLFCHSCEDISDRYLPPRLYSSVMTWRSNSKLFFEPRRGNLRELYWLDADPAETRNCIAELDQRDLRTVDEAISRYWARMDRRAYHPPALLIEDLSLLDRLTNLGYLE